MSDIIRVRSLASAAALTLAIVHPAWSGEEPAAGSAAPAAPVVTPESVVAPIAPPAAPAPAAVPAAPMAAPAAEQPPAPPADQASAPEPAPAAEVNPAEAARAKAEARRAEMDAERNKRYQELRERAKEVGLELPETPPWESAQAGMPQMPAHGGPSAEQFQAMREQRESMREKMKSMTPEERKAMREAHWNEMRERAAERGIEMPETPPWEEAEKRYQEARAQFEQYRKTVEEMTEEQVEAARAIFGRAGGPSDAGQGMSQPMPPQMPQMPQMHQMPQGYGYGPQGGYPGHTPYQGGPGQMMMGRPPMQPYYEGGMDQGPPAPMGPQGY